MRTVKLLVAFVVFAALGRTAIAQAPSCSNPTPVWYEIGGGAPATAVIAAGTVYTLGSGACTVAATQLTLDLSAGNLGIMQSNAPQLVPVTNKAVTPAVVNNVQIPALGAPSYLISGTGFSFTIFAPTFQITPASGSTLTVAPSGDGFTCK